MEHNPKDPPAPERGSRKRARVPRRLPIPSETQEPARLGADVQAAFAALDRATRALARARGIGASFRGVEMRIHLGNGEPPSALSERFLTELSSRLDEELAAEGLVVPNRAFCLRCESFLCPHARPRDAREVMAGYEPTGRPRWVEFLTRIVDRRDEHTTRVAEGVPGVLAIAEDGSTLTRDRIQAFGGESPDVEVLSQVIAGLFPLDPSTGEEGAVTIQCLRVRTPSGPRLVVQPIGDPRLLSPARAAGDLDLQRILAAARAAVKGTNPRPNVSLEETARSLTNDLARDLEHCFHVRSRRTRHARERAAIGVRPTSHAFPEARAARACDIRVDHSTGAFVLVGRNARVHFFSQDGRHVSSVRFPGTTIRARISTGRWRPALPGEVARFRARVGGKPAREDES